MRDLAAFLYLRAATAVAGKGICEKQVSSINDQNDHLNDWFAQLRTKA
ncbi:MAG: hypothetical protein WBH22_10100 [Pseudomonas mandelii]|jgi:hypothetical protein|nr:hypothetical protein [Pseudomonas silensiensis]